jgi:surface antigen
MNIKLRRWETRQRSPIRLTLLVMVQLAGALMLLTPASPAAAASAVTDNAIVKQSQAPSDPTSWLLIQGQRYWIPTSAVYNCLKSAGVQGPVLMSNADLNARPDQSGQHASCGQGNDPHGAFDSVSLSQPGQLQVRGWSADRNVVRRSIGIHIYVGGKAGSGAQGFNLGRPSAHRPDVNRVYPGYGDYHGFDTLISTTRWGRQEVCAYAINVGPGSNVLLGCKTVTIKAPLPSNIADTCTAATTFACLSRFNYGSGGTGSWTEKYYRYDAASGYHNCTRFVGFFLEKYAGITDPGGSFGDAWNWGKTDAQGGQTNRTSMRERGYTVSATPRVGSVAWWDRDAGKGSVGHVGIVVAVGSDYVVVASDNYRSGAVGSADVTRISRTGAWPTGFIYSGL